MEKKLWMDNRGRKDNRKREENREVELRGKENKW